MRIDRLKELRQNRKLTQAQMADQLKIPRTTYAAYEQGKREPDDSIKLRMADLFNVTTDYLLGNNQTPKWAKNEDTIELKDYLDSNVNMAFSGVSLNKEQKKRVDEILTQVFWEELKKAKMGTGDDVHEQ